MSRTDGAWFYEFIDSQYIFSSFFLHIHLQYQMTQFWNTYCSINSLNYFRASIKTNMCHALTLMKKVHIFGQDLDLEWNKIKQIVATLSSLIKKTLSGISKSTNWSPYHFLKKSHALTFSNFHHKSVFLIKKIKIN